MSFSERTRWDECLNSYKFHTLCFESRDDVTKQGSVHTIRLDGDERTFSGRGAHGTRVGNGGGTWLTVRAGDMETTGVR